MARLGEIETLRAKLDLLNLEQCDRLLNYLLEFWMLPDIRNTEQRLRDIGAFVRD